MGLFSPRLSTKHMSRLTFHLWSLYRSGTTLRRAFALLDDRSFPLPLRRVGRQVAHGLEQGETLAQALTHVEHRIPAMAHNLLAVGEQSGGLERVLAFLHTHYERRLSIQRKALAILLYPFLIYVSHHLISFAQGLVMTIEPLDVYVWNYVREMGVYFGTRLAMLVMMLRLLDQWNALVPIVDNITARVPLLRGVFVRLAMARFFRGLRLMLDSGCHVVTALEVAIRGTSNTVLERRLRRAISAVKDGQPMLESMAETGALPEFVRDMLVTGELAGKSEENLEAAAEYLEAEATTTIRLVGAGFGMLVVASFVWGLVGQGVVLVVTLNTMLTGR